MRPILPLSILLIALGTAPAFAAGPCTGFKWDVSKELALFNGPSVALSAAKNAAAAPTIGADRFYQLQLLPQAEVAFAVTPARSTATDGAYAGLVNLKLDAPGSYRIAVPRCGSTLRSTGNLRPPRIFRGSKAATDRIRSSSSISAAGGSSFCKSAVRPRRRSDSR